MSAVLTFSFIGLLVLGAPIAFAMLIAGLLAVWMKPGLTALVVVQNMFSGLDSFPLLAIPFFILAAELMTGGALTDVLLHLAARLVGRRRGGLGHANILTLTFFSGISGSALADAAGPGAMLIKMMKKAGYSDAYAAALTASVAIVGPIIPPSIIMIIYALTDNSVTVTGLFLAGVVPGLLISGALAVVNHMVSTKRNYRASEELMDSTPMLRLFVRALPALMLPFIILGGIHFGVFTPTEASAAAVLYALLVGRFVYGTLRMHMLPAILFRTALMTASIMFIVATSAVLAWVLTVGQIPQTVTAWVAGLELSPFALLLAINVLLLIVGIFIEPLPGVMIMVPILAPLADAAGLNPLHFAIVVIVNLTLGMITPPVGGLLFVTSIVSGVPMGRMVREARPMLVALLAVLLLLTFIPALSTWLPGLMGYRN
ncbi:MAG: TRAP transporter large permease [Comamonadaceae bacterium]|nr:MAG: TRAP transporter large permease [Comamonadaceae bacterium]